MKSEQCGVMYQNGICCCGCGKREPARHTPPAFRQFQPRHNQGRAFGSYDPRTDGPPYEPDYEDEHGSSHVRACPKCGAGEDEPCEDDCPMVTG